MRPHHLILCALAFSANQGWAAPVPRFEDYPVAEFAGRVAQVRLADRRSRQYASTLRAAAQGTPNFAGHYILATWGCGASCVTGAAIDARTGVVAWLPFTVCCWAAPISEPLEFRRNSNLLVIHGLAITVTLPCQAGRQGSITRDLFPTSNRQHHDAVVREVRGRNQGLPTATGVASATAGFTGVVS